MGSRLVSKAQKYTTDARAGIYTHDVDTPTTGGQMTASFPRGGLSAESKRDELVREKMQMMDPATGMSAFGMVQATDADFKYLQKKRETEEAAKLDAWIGKNFHTNDVALRKWLQEVYPDYYEVREREMVDHAKFALRVQLLLLRGPKTQEDLILMWGLQTGQIHLDRDWNVIGPSVTGPMDAQRGALEQKRFQYQLMSPWRYPTDEMRKQTLRDYSATSPNPFSSNKTGGGGQQIPAPFSTGAAVNPKQYPNFLSGVLDPLIKGGAPNQAGPAGAQQGPPPPFSGMRFN